jgi:SAM-dependent methyltransferase
MTTWDDEKMVEYRALLSGGSDSAYLRKISVEDFILGVVGSQPGFGELLDVGCGTGWLSKALPDRQERVWQCDLVADPAVADAPRFSIQDAGALSYDTGMFDQVVASLVLPWISDLDRCCAELGRVTRAGGYLMVTIPHPFGYRTGYVTEDEFRVTDVYGQERIVEDVKIGGMVSPMTYYHRPLSRYFEAFQSGNWTVDEFHEWTIDMDEYRRVMQGRVGRIQRTDRVPLFAFFVCQKGF